MQQST
jgi:hypothetical protein